MSYIRACMELANSFSQHELECEDIMQCLESADDDYRSSVEKIYHKIYVEHGSADDLVSLMEALNSDTSNTVGAEFDRYGEEIDKFIKNINEKINDLNTSEDFKKHMEYVQVFSRGIPGFKKKIASSITYLDGVVDLIKLSREILSKIKSCNISDKQLTAWRQIADKYEISKKPEPMDFSLNDHVRNMKGDYNLLKSMVANGKQVHKAIDEVKKKLPSIVSMRGSVPAELGDAFHIHNRAFNTTFLRLWKDYTSHVAAIFKIVDAEGKRTGKNLQSPPTKENL